MHVLKRKEMLVKPSRWISLPVAGIAMIAALSGCGDSGNPLSPLSQLDSTPPPAPENLRLANDASGHPVLTWNESAAPDVFGYQVYVYSSLPGGGNDFVVANDVVSVNPIFRLPSAIESVEASYRVRAVDGAGNWSSFSATADIFIPVRSGSGGKDPYVTE